MRDDRHIVVIQYPRTERVYNILRGQSAHSDNYLPEAGL